MVARRGAAYDRRMIADATGLSDGRGPAEVLTPRELEVLQLTSRGMTNAQVAERLGVTVHAIKFHLAAIYRKLGVANRTEAVVRLLSDGRGD